MLYVKLVEKTRVVTVEWENPTIWTVLRKNHLCPDSVKQTIGRRQSLDAAYVWNRTYGSTDIQPRYLDTPPAIGYREAHTSFWQPVYHARLVPYPGQIQFDAGDHVLQIPLQTSQPFACAITHALASLDLSLIWTKFRC